MERRQRKTGGVPVLKLPANRLVTVLQALGNHEFDREGFKQAVLGLFASKTEKSVFRGMAVPTLRALGLLIGFDAEMRLSGDGALALEVAVPNQPALNLAIQRIVMLVERQHRLDVAWIGGPLEADNVVSTFGTLEGSLSADFAGQVRRWVSYLEFFGIVVRNGPYLDRKTVFVDMAFDDYSLRQVASDLYETYRRIAPGGVGEPVVTIEELHRAFAIEQWKRQRSVVIRWDFDTLLRSLMHKKFYGLHLHRSMGAEQRLFAFEGNHFQAISIAEMRS